MKSQHNSVLHAFSVPDWSDMCGVVGVLTVLLLLPTQYTAGEIFKMWCQEFDKYLLANIYIDIDITLLISDMDFPYQFNLRLHNFEVFFSNVEKKKKKKKVGRSVISWAKWLIMLGFMDLKWPRVARRSNVGLVLSVVTLLSSFNHKARPYQEHGTISDIHSFSHFRTLDLGSRIQISK